MPTHLVLSSCSKVLFLAYAGGVWKKTGVCLAHPLASDMVGQKQGGFMGSHFGYDDGLHGLFVVVEREPLSPGCVSIQEIDSSIELLKGELDRVAMRMKAALASRTPLSADGRDA